MKRIFELEIYSPAPNARVIVRRSFTYSDNALTSAARLMHETPHAATAVLFLKESATHIFTIARESASRALVFTYWRHKCNSTNSSVTKPSATKSASSRSTATSSHFSAARPTSIHTSSRKH